MEKNRAGRNRRRVIWIDMLALAGILVIAAVIWSGFLEDAAQENLATKTGQQTTEEVPENPLQIILSMGAEPGESVHQLERRRRRAGGLQIAEIAEIEISQMPGLVKSAW